MDLPISGTCSDPSFAVVQQIFLAIGYICLANHIEFAVLAFYYAWTFL
jgi:hypothetical protein